MVVHIDSRFEVLLLNDNVCLDIGFLVVETDDACPACTGGVHCEGEAMLSLLDESSGLRSSNLADPFVGNLDLVLYVGLN